MKKKFFFFKKFGGKKISSIFAPSFERGDNEKSFFKQKSGV